MEGEKYVERINTIKDEISRRNQGIQKLREQRKVYESQLYNYMEKNNLNKVGNITKNSIKPKDQRAPRKRVSDQRSDALKFFRAQGIPDPRGFYEKFKQTQKISSKNNQSNI